MRQGIENQVLRGGRWMELMDELASWVELLITSEWPIILFVWQCSANMGCFQTNSFTNAFTTTQETHTLSLSLSHHFFNYSLKLKSQQKTHKKKRK